MTAMSSVVSPHDAAVLDACATDGAVLATVVSAAYAKALLSLASSARQVGFKCMVVQPYVPPEELFKADDVKQLKSEQEKRFGGSSLVGTLSLPSAPLLPRSQWCGSQRYGWRRAHFYRTRLWRIVFEHGLDLLAVDLDWSFVDLHGVPLRFELPHRSLRAARTMSGGVPDIVALHDGKPKGLFNVGLMFVRASKAVVELARRCQLRTLGGWEQGIFNEELNYRFTDLQCCHAAARTECDLRSFVRSIDTIHNQGHEGPHADLRRKAEGSDQCLPSGEGLGSAPGPPSESRYVWAPTGSVDGAGEDGPPPPNSSRSGWDAAVYNKLRRRPLARCTEMHNVCKCPQLAKDDDYWRAVNGIRIRHWLERHPEQINLTVRGRAFRLGMLASSQDGGHERGSRAAGSLEGSSQEPSDEVMLRDWIGWKPPKQLLGAKPTPQRSDGLQPDFYAAASGRRAAEAAPSSAPSPRRALV